MKHAVRTCDRASGLRPPRPRPRRPPGASSASTPTPPAVSASRARRWSRTGTSSSSGRATPGRKRLGMFGQRFAASGAPRGSEFQINTYTTGHQHVPAVAVGSRGDFVVVWQERRQDGSGASIQGQRFDAAGSRHRRRVPGQHLHDGLPVPPARRPGLRWPVRRESGRARTTTAAPAGSPPAGSTRRATPSAASSW